MQGEAGRRFRAAVLVGVGLSILCCDKLPNDRSAIPVLPDTPETVPTPFPSPLPTLVGATPTPAPATTTTTLRATPTTTTTTLKGSTTTTTLKATPSPTPTPGGANTCSLPPMPDGSPCQKESASFYTLVVTAQDQVKRTRPDLFTDSTGTFIKNESAYVQEVARVLRTYGVCASQGGPSDEVAVKTSNDFNEQFDIVVSTGAVWTNYTVTCRPSRF